MQASQFIGCVELFVEGNDGGVVSGAVVVLLAADSAASFFLCARDIRVGLVKVE